MFEKCHLCGRSSGIRGATSAGFRRAADSGLREQEDRPWLDAADQSVWLCAECRRTEKNRDYQEEYLERQQKRERQQELKRQQELERASAEQSRIERLKTEGDVDELVEVVEGGGSSDSQRCSAAAALAAIGDARGVEPLIKVFQHACLGEQHLELRDSAIGALKQFGPAAMDALVAALQDVGPFDEFRRTAAATALGEIRDERAIEPLFDALHVDNFSNHGYYRDSSGTLIREQADAIEADRKRRRECEAVGEALGMMGSAARQRLVAVLRADQDPFARYGAARGLGAATDAQERDCLVAALDDKSPLVQEAARAALQGPET